jgi:hypothetical protein
MTVTLPTTFNNAGTINLLATGLNHNIALGSGSTLNNIGTPTINPGPTADGGRTLNLTLNNSGTFNVNASTVFNNNLTNTGTSPLPATKRLATAGRG